MFLLIYIYIWQNVYIMSDDPLAAKEVEGNWTNFGGKYIRLVINDRKALTAQQMKNVQATLEQGFIGALTQFAPTRQRLRHINAIHFCTC